MEEKWKISDLGRLLKNSFLAILQGQFLLRMNAGKYFIHIAYTFFLFGVVIWLSLMIETSMAKVEKNKETLKELEIAHSQKSFELASLCRRSETGIRLSGMGSDIKEAVKPATILVR